MCFEGSEHGFTQENCLWKNGIDLNYLAKKRV